jgi:Protein of unknown function (DUF1566)
MNYCAELGLAGSGWRLPLQEELVSLVVLPVMLDPAVEASPTIDAVAFPNTPSEFFWSSSLTRDASNRVWGVGFRHGSVANYEPGTLARVRCVR